MDASDMVCFNRTLNKLDNIYASIATLPEINPTFANNSWSTIAAWSEAGMASRVWKADGTCTKDITLTTGEILTLEILGFNHDAFADRSGYAGLTIGLKELMDNQRRINDIGGIGFLSSEIGQWLNNDLYNTLPDDLKPFIKTVTKRTSLNGTNSLVLSEDVKIFLFSEIEVSNTRQYSARNEGTQYLRFKDPYSRIKKLSNGLGSANKWWERSPDDDTNYCCVGSNGYVTSESAANLAGICFGFCI